MPPLLLDDDEAVAIAVGLRTAAGTSVAGIEETAVRALVKLEQVLPSHLRRRVQAMQSVTAATPDGGPTVDPGALTVIATATRDRERVRFGYQARDGSESRRLAEPHSLVNLGRRWYLVAWDCDRRAWRTYRMDRVERPRPAGSRFEPRELPAADPAEFVSANLANAPQRFQARLTLHAPADELRDRHPYWWGQFEPLGEQRCEYRTGDDSLEWLAMRVCMLGVEFEVHEPPELVGALAALGDRIGRATSRAR
jgi:predicted DNA-binding transcriptional regulator YafY